MLRAVALLSVAVASCGGKTIGLAGDDDAGAAVPVDHDAGPAVPVDHDAGAAVAVDDDAAATSLPAAADAMIPACSWPVAPGMCSAARGRLHCANPTVDGLGCPTNDLKTCSWLPSDEWTCRNECQPTEYSLFCEYRPNAPAACRLAEPPGTTWVFVYCCPCGT
jgi:hypothetical protein